MRGIFIIILALGLTNESHGQLSKSLVKGSYQNKEYGERLIFSDSLFVHFRPVPHHLVPLWAAHDTIAFGKWDLKHNGRQILITSPQNYLEFKVDLKVNEETVPNNDTIRLLIHSPAEIAYYNENEAVSGVAYWVVFYSGSRKIFLQSIDKCKMDSKFEFLNSSHIAISSFVIIARPSAEYPIEERGATEAQGTYNILNVKSNRFVISIPELTINYFAAERFEKYPIKIINSNTLKFKELLFVKE